MRDITSLVLLLALCALSARAQQYDFLELSNESMTLSNNGRSLVVTFSSDDLFAIQEAFGVGADAASSFVSVSSQVVRDMSGIAAAPVPTDNALPITTFTPDTTAPALLTFDLDISNTTGLLTLTFSETVDVGRLDVSGLTLASAPAAAAPREAFALVTSAPEAGARNSTVVVVELSLDDLNAIKALPALAAANATFLSAAAAAVLDMAGNGLVPATDLPVTSFVDDATRPVLTAFDVDLTREVLRLEFSETVEANTFLASAGLVLQSAACGTANVSLTAGMVTSPDGPTLNLTLALADLNAIKSEAGLAVSSATTFLTASALVVADHAANALVPIPDCAALPVRTFVADAVSPELTAFDLDLDAGTLTLSFSESVDHASLLASALVLLSGANGTASRRLTAAGASVLSARGPVLRLALAAPDLDAIKADVGLAVSNATTALSIEAPAVADNAGNPVVAVAAAAPLPVALLTPDATAIALVSFALDLDSGVLELTFDETVNVSSIQAGELTLQASSNSTAFSRTLTGGLVSATGDLRAVNLSLAVADLNEIKRLPLAVDLASTFLSLAAPAARDMAGNPTVAVPPTAALQAAALKADATAPLLVSFDLDLDNETIALTFDETVDASTLLVGQLTVQNLATGASSAHTLVTAVALPVADSDVLALRFSTADANVLKADVSLATDDADTFLGIANGGVLDMAGNPIAQFPSGTAIRVRNHTADATAPALVAFDLDLDAGALTLRFDETVDPASFSAPAIALQHEASAGAQTQSVALGPAGSLVTTAPSTSLVLQLARADVDRITQQAALAVDPNSTFLTLNASAVSDMVGLAVVLVPGSAALPVAAFVADATPPQLLSFDLDVSSNGTLTLLFDETVRAASIVPSRFSLGDPNATLAHRLQAGNVTSGDGTRHQILLATSDLNAVKLLDGVLTPQARLQLDLAALADMAGNPIAPVAQGVALFTPDSTSPALLRFAVNLNATSDQALLTLNFDEPVDVSSVDFAQLILQPAQGAPTSDRLGLTGGSIASPDGLELLLTLSRPDADEVKRRANLFTSRTDAFLSATSQFVRDRAANPLATIPNNLALQAELFVADALQPALLAFDLDMDAGSLRLTFDETVNASSLDVTALTLQSSSNAAGPPFQHRLSSATAPVAPADGLTLTLALAAPDLDELKRKRIGVSAPTSFLTLPAGALRDMAGQPLLARTNGLNALPVSAYTPDATAPALASFALDLTAETLTLAFGETVDAATLQVAALTLQSTAAGGPGAAAVTLSNTSSQSLSLDGTSLVLDLGLDDLNRIKAKRALAAAPGLGDVFLSAPAGLVADVFGNPFAPILASAALPAANFTPDATAPTLLGYDLDLNASSLTLRFDETVDLTTLSTPAFVLGSPAGQALALSNATVVASGSADGPVVRLDLGLADTDALKALPALAIDAASTLLSVSAAGVRDMAGNPLTPVLEQPVQLYTPDATAPALLFFDLDLTAEVLLLGFSETVRASTLAVARLTLQDAACGLAAQVNLTVAANASAADANTLAVTLSLADLNAIKAERALCTSAADCFLAVGADAVQDMDGNRVEPRVTCAPAAGAAPAAVRAFVADATAPTLEAFDLDLTLETLTLSFSETVDPLTLGAAAATLQNQTGASAASIVLSQGNFSTAPASVIIVALAQADVLAITAADTLAINAASTFLSVTAALVSDMAGTPVTPTELAVQVYTADAVAPQVSSFDLDLSTGRLLVRFDETVESTSIVLAEATLGSDANLTLALALTGGNASDPDQAAFELVLSAADLNAVKALALCTSATDCFLSVTSAFAADMVGNAVQATAAGQALPVAQFIADSVRPALVDFPEFNLNAGTFTLLFSETMNVSSVGLATGQAELHSFFTSAPVTFALTGGSVVGANSPTVVFQLSVADLNAIKNEAALCTDVSDCFVRFTAGFLADMAGNSVVAEPAGTFKTSVFPRVFVADTTPPAVASVALDMEAETLLLVWDEPVVALVDTTRLALVGANGAERRLADSVVLTAANGLQVQIQLGPADVIAIKAEPDLATSAANVDLRADAAAAQDTTGGVPSLSQTVAVAVFTADAGAPVVAAFSRYNANLGVFRVLFDEPVNITSLVASAVVLQADASAGSLNHTLAAAASIAYVDASTRLELEVVASDADLVAIKGIIGLGNSRANSFLTLLDAAVADMAGNPIAATVGVPLTGDFFADENAPTIVSVSLNLTTGTLGFLFDDVVDASSASAAGFVRLQAVQAGTADPALQVVLTGGATTSPDGFAIELQLTAADLNAIKARRGLATSRNDSFVAFTSDFIKDVLTTPATAVLATNALQVATFGADTVPPRLTAFDLDVDAGTLTLSFDEVVDADTLQAADLVLHNQSGGALHRLTNSATAQTGAVEAITVALSATDLNAIKALDKLSPAVAAADRLAFLTFTAALVRDMGALPVVPRAGVAVSSLAFDATAPNLVGFDLDMGAGLLALTFDETVRVAGLNTTGLVLQDAAPASAPGSVALLARGSASPDGTRVEVALGADNLNAIKLNDAVAVSAATAFLSLTGGSVADMNGNPVVAIPNASALPVGAFVQDLLAPVLEAYDLDLDSGVLTLIFDEVVRASTLNAAQLLLGSDAAGTVVVSLSTSGVTTGNGLEAAVPLSAVDLNQVKLQRSLAVSNTTAFLDFSPALLQDMRGNQAAPVADRPPRLFTPDTTPPTLVSFAFSADSGVLTLTFDEAVDAALVTASGITLQRAANVAGGMSRVLQSAASLSGDGVVLQVAVSAADLNEVKRLYGLAVSQATTFLSLLAGAFVDMAGNPSVAIPNSAGQQAIAFEADATAPTLVAAALNMSAGTLDLSFSETVDVSTFDVAALLLQGAAGGDGGSTGAVRLTLGTAVSNLSNATVVSLALGASDLDRLKADRGLCVSAGTCFTAFSSSLVADMAGIPVTAVNTSNAVQVQAFTADAIAPTLLELAVDLDAGALTFVFDEIVDVATAVPARFTLQPNATSAAGAVVLSSTTAVSPGNNATVVFGLVQGDLNVLKADVSLATGVGDSFLSTVAKTITDMAGNPLAAISAGAAFQASNHTADATAPALVAFDLDLDAGALTLRFDETVDPASFSAPAIALQHEASAGAQTQSVALGPAGSLVTTAPSTSLVLQLARADVDRITQQAALAVDPNSTFLTLNASAVSDMVGLAVVLVPGSAALPVAAFVADATPPQLLSFDLDVSSNGTLTLLFDETVRAASIVPSRFSLGDPNATLAHRLQAGNVTSGDGTRHQILLATSDLNAVKLLDGVLTPQARLQLDLAALADMAGNPIAPVAQGVALFTPDSTSPALLRFAVNLNATSDQALLTLNFDEPVDVSSVDFAQLILQPAQGAPTSDRLGLTGGSIASPDGLELLLTLSRPDADEVKRRANLFTSRTDAFLSATSQFVRDRAANPLATIPNNLALQAELFVADALQPALLAFDLDMDAGSLRLTFDETVNASSLDVTALTLQSSSNAAGPPFQHRLSSATAPVAPADGLTLTLALAAPDLDELKRKRIGVSAPTSFLTLPAGALRDMAGQPLLARTNGLNALPVSAYTPDATAPALASFALDLTAETLTLAFGETVDAATLQVAALTLQSTAAGGPGAAAVTLSNTSSQSLSLDGTSLVLDLGLDDLNRIKAKRALAAAPGLGDVFLSAPAGLVADVFGNPFAPILASAALPAANFTPDATAPTLLGYDLDLNASSLTLRFDETVDLTTLSTPAFVLGSPAGQALALSNATVVASGSADGPVVRLDLGLADTDALKALPALAIDAASTLLSVSAAGVRDMAGNPLTPVLEQPVQLYTPDATAPALLFFDLDLTAEVLLLGFSETVRASTLAVARLTLQDAACGLAAQVNLTVAANASAADANTLAVTLSLADLNAIKAERALCTSAADCFLAVGADAVQDMDGNRVEPRVTCAPAAGAAPAAVRAFVADATAPTLEAFDLDLTLETLTLSFSETVDPLTLGAAAVTLQSTRNGTGASTALLASLPLTVPASASSPATVLTLGLTTPFLNDVKSLAGLAVDAASAFLSFGPFVSDMAANAIGAVPAGAGVRAQTYTADATAPTLAAFDLDMETGILTLTFDETVDAASFAASAVQIQDRVVLGGNGSAEALTASSLVSSAGNGPVVVVAISAADLDVLKLNPTVAKSAGSTFLSLAPAAIADTAGNAVVAVAGRPVGVFTADTTLPTLLAFALDLQNGTLTMTFSEAMRVNSLQTPLIALQDSSLAFRPPNSTEPLNTVRLTAGSASPSANGPVVVVALGTADLDNIKRVRGLATAVDNTFITFAAAMARDLNGNAIEAVVDGGALRAAAFVGDGTSPRLTAWEAVMGPLGPPLRFRLTFSETVDVTTLDLTKLVVQSERAASPSSTSYRLTAGSARPVPGSTAP